MTEGKESQDKNEFEKRAEERADFERTMERLIIEEKELELLKAKLNHETAQKADRLHIALLEQRLANEEFKMRIMESQDISYRMTQERIQEFFADAKSRKADIKV